MNIFSKFIKPIFVTVDDFDINTSSILVQPALTDAKTLERLSERSYVRDWQRLGLCGNSTSPTTSRQKAEQFRITSVNTMYMLCRR